MKKKILISSILAVALLILVSIAPSINASIVKDELVELDVEFCGLGKKHTVKLTQQEAKEVERLFNDTGQKVSQVETREETEEIFKEAIVELDRYGLLGGMSVKQVQNLIFGNNIKQRLIDKLKFIYKNILDDDANYFCLVCGTLKNLRSFNIFSMPRSSYLIHLYDWLDDFVNREIMYILGYWLITNLLAMEMFSLFTSYFPISLFSTITAGYWEHDIGTYPGEYFYSKGTVYSKGLGGYKEWSGGLKGDASHNLEMHTLFCHYYPAFIGYTGLKIYLNDYSYFIGFSLKASLTNV